MNVRMKRPSRWARRILIALVVGALFIGAYVLYGPTLGAFNRMFRMPAVVHSPFVEALSTSPDLAAAQRQRFLDAWRERRDYGLHRVQATVEATPVGLWIITTGGTLTLVTDYSRDVYSRRSIEVAMPESVELGTPTPGTQHPLRAWFPASQLTYLRCRFANGNVEFF